MHPFRFSGKLAALAVLCAFLTSLAGVASATEPGTYAKALAQAKAENKLVVIDFMTDW